MPLTISPPTAPTADVDALLARVADLEAAQRDESVERFVALVDDVAVWVTAAGRRLIGRDAIDAFTRQVLPGALATLSVRYEAQHINFLTDDVAVTMVDQRYSTIDGVSLPSAGEGRPSYVWRRTGDRWLLVLGQNTLVASDLDHELSAEDETAIRQIIGDVERGFNENDPEPMVRHIADDALVVNALGTVIRGRDEIDRVTRAGLSAGALAAATAHYRVTDLAHLSPEVVVAHKSAWSTPAAADAGEEPEMNALYVFVRRDGRWWIVRRQNTLVPATP